MPRTLLCDLLGIEHPILSVGFGPTAGPDLAAAVSAAGGCGVLGGSNVPPELLRERIRAVRARTDRPFGVTCSCTGRRIRRWRFALRRACRSS